MRYAVRAYFDDVRVYNLNPILRLAHFLGYLIDQLVNTVAGAFKSFWMRSDHLNQLWYIGRYLQRDKLLVHKRKQLLDSAETYSDEFSKSFHCAEKMFFGWLSIKELQ